MYSRLFRLFSREEKLPNAIRGRLRIPDNGVLIDSDELPSPFDGPAVDEHPFHVLRLCVQDDLADGVEPRREIQSVRVQDDQVGSLPDRQRTDPHFFGDREGAGLRCHRRYAPESSGRISSAGLRVFMMAAREVRGKGSLAMAGPKPHVKQVLDLAGVATFAKVYDTATEAVETLNQSSH